MTIATTVTMTMERKEEEEEKEKRVETKHQPKRRDVTLLFFGLLLSFPPFLHPLLNAI